MNIYDFIVQANQEFTLNGRSKRFVGMEDRILRSGKTLPIYFFARYTKGIDVKKFEKYMLNNATLDECYYFGMYVPGAKMMPFVQRALDENEEILAKYMVKFAKSNGEIVGKTVKQEFIDNGINLANNVGTKLDDTLDRAITEYELNGRSELYNDYEQKILYAPGDANGLLFAKHVPGANIKAFQKSVIMRGNPLNCYEFATDVKGISKNLMLASIQLSLLDYVEIEKDELRFKRILETVKENYRNATTDEERIKYSKALEELTKRHTYKDKARGYIARIQKMQRDEQRVR